MPKLSAASLASTSLGLTAFGGGMQTVAQLQAGKAAQAAHYAQARQFEQAATMAELENRQNILRMRKETRHQIARMRATLAANGAVLTSGSNADVLGVATTRIETQIADESRRGSMRTRSLRHRGANSRFAGDQSLRASRIGALSSGLDSLSTFTSDIADYRHTGAL